MSTFACPVQVIRIESHPDPEVTALEVGKIGDYNVVVRKGLYQTGQLVVYIPEGSIVPESILKEIGLEGKLAGSAKNRVKAMKLRGVMSQGLVYVPNPESGLTLVEGDDLSKTLGITKYEPPIPACLAGEFNSHPDVSLSFDIEDIKKYPTVFQEGEEVVFTEKIHGTFCMIGLVHPSLRREDMLHGKAFVSSKGQGAKGLYLKANEKNIEKNSYLQAVLDNELVNKLEGLAANFLSRPCRQNIAMLKENATLWLLGEVYGVQKGYGYGCKGAPGFRAFAIKVGNEYLSNRDLFEGLCEQYGIPFAPVLYRGPFSYEKLKEFTSGKESVSGGASHIREGIVVTPVEEKYSPELQRRAILKSVSDEYLGKATGEEVQ